MSPLSHAAQKRPEFRPSLMAVLVALLLPSVHAEARDYFNPALLQQTGTGGTVPDLSAFENGGQLPGRYPVDIYLNDEQVDSRDVTFSRPPRTAFSLVWMQKLWRDMAFVQSYFLDYSLKASSAWIFQRFRTAQLSSYSAHIV